MLLRLLAVGCLVSLVSGAAALSHEMLWTRRLIDLLGGSSESNTRVLSLFFLGLSLGATWAHLHLRRITRPWLAAAVAEGAIGVLALPALFLPSLTAWLWPALGAESLVGTVGILVKVAISVLVVLPPAIAMGMTLPIFVTAILRGRGRLDREGIWLYAANTIGGLVGLLIAGGVLLQTLGASGTMATTIGVNGLLALVCLTLDRLERRFVDFPQGSAALAESPSDDPVGDSVLAASQRGRLDLPIVVAMASGAGLLATEVVALQSLMLVVPISFFGPFAILSAVILLLAIAAPLASGLGRGQTLDVRWWLPRTVAATGVLAIVSPFLYLSLARVISMGPAQTTVGFLVHVAWFAILCFGPLLLLMGMTFPFAIVLHARASGVGEYAARRDRWVILLAFNGLGGLLGAEIAYRVLLPSGGVHTSMGVIGVGYLALAIYAAHRIGPRWAPSPWVFAGMSLIGIAVVNGYLPKLPQINPYLGFKVLSQRVGADGLVAVVEGEGFGRGILVSNQYMLGSTGVQHDQQRQAHVPLLLHPQPSHVGFIGLATGITPGGSLQHESVRQVTIAEISGTVVAAADQFFGESNHSVTRDNRASVHVVDGRTFVAASPDAFDVLIGDLFLPWGAGASRLHSVEHFESVRRSLKPGGLFCQWLPMYQLTREHFDAVVTSFQQAFDHVHLFRNNADPIQPMVALVGFHDAQLDWDVVRRRCEQTRESDRVLDPSIRHWEAFATLYLGQLRSGATEGQRITLDNMFLEISAGRERVTGNPAKKYLQGERWIAWLSDAIPERLQSESREDVDRWRKLGRSLITWQWAKLTKAPDAETRRQQILEQLPSVVIQEADENRQLWPGNAGLFDPR